MIALDTNVVSEMMKAEVAPRFRDWIGLQDVDRFWLTSITVAELYFGAALLSEGRRRQAMFHQIDRMIAEDFGDRVADFGVEAAIIYAEIAAGRRRAGRPISPLDCQIAAITRASGATLATRNIKHFEGCGIDLVDPWSA